jgi:glycosyltransferase involved in cell wall biosynthesis
MKILHLISSMAAAGGGPAEAVRLLASIQSRDGHAVEIATLDAPAALATPSDAVPVLPLGPGRGKFGYAPGLLHWLRRNRQRFDAVIVHGLWQYHSFAAWRALRATSTPYYVFPHGMLDPWFKREYPRKHLKKWLYWPWADYRVLRDARAVLFTCEEERRLARESFWLYRAREVVTGLGTAAPPFDLVSAVQEFHRKHPELPERRVILFMGRLHPKKGCDLLIEAFARTLGRHADWQLVMAGPDQVGWQPELHRMTERLGVADRVLWTGMLTGPEKWGALAAAEVFALPSHQENFGIAVAEALACGTPVLLSRQVNIWREVQACGAGLVSEDTVEATTRLLEQWLHLADPGREAMRLRAQRCFQEHFDVIATAKRLMSLITSDRLETP